VQGAQRRVGEDPSIVEIPTDDLTRSHGSFRNECDEECACSDGDF